MQWPLRLRRHGDQREGRGRRAQPAAPLACRRVPPEADALPSVHLAAAGEQGVIQDTTAFAKFHVTFECIVFRPFKGEVLDCIVTSVNKVCA